MSAPAPPAPGATARGVLAAQQCPTALALILARAGSKGAPGKNTAPLAGRPCIAWTLDAALAARTIAHIAVSTDDPAAAAIARQLGVTVIDRPPALATDTARIDDAARHALTMWDVGCRMSEVKATREPRARAHPTSHIPHPASSPIVILYANVPIRPAGLIDRAVRLLVETGCDSVQSYSPVGKFHPWWTARLEPEPTGASGAGVPPAGPSGAGVPPASTSGAGVPPASSGRVLPWQGDTLNHNIYRRQDLPPAFIPDGGVLVVSRRALLGEIPGVPPGPHAFFGLDRRGLISGGEVIDIDSPRDLIVADTVLRSSHADRPATDR
ncbi:MAG: acylneuraminate cytidylyltransferase family protein [Phycisphaerales bacterium]